MKKKAFLLWIAIFLMTVNVQAATYNFDLISSVPIESSFEMKVAQGTGGVDFTFRNTADKPSITDIYFDYDLTVFTDLSFVIDNSSPGVSFSVGADPSAFLDFVVGYSADSDSPVPKNGVNAPGEWLTIEITDSNDSDPLNELIAALNSGKFRVGLRTQMGSESGDYVNNVPVPSAIWLLGSGLVGLVGYRRRCSKR